MSEQRGGARPGAGRKPKGFSSKRIDAMLKAARRYRRKCGKSPEELLMDIAYKADGAQDATLAQRVRALGIYFQHTMPTTSESEITVNKPRAPYVYRNEDERKAIEAAQRSGALPPGGICLPETDLPPNVVVMDGGKKD